MQGKVASYKNLSVRFLDDEQLARLTALANRNLQLQASLQEGTIWLSDAQNSLEIQFAELATGAGLISAGIVKKCRHSR